jgi:chloride channel 7
MFVHPVLSWFVLIVFGIVYVIIASSLTVFIAPTALGSGVAEAMGMLNGINYPDYISFKVLGVKFLGLAFAVSGGLCGGKEGPLVHMGSIVGMMTAYLPFKIFDYFRNDVEKRKLLAAGIASGVSAAFGAPIGGSLFAYEISKPNTFWSFSLTWKVFFASSISTFVLSILKQLYEGEKDIKLINSGNVKLAANKDDVFMDALVAAVIIGIVGGMVGSLFIRVNNMINIYRKKLLNTKLKKILEACILIVITSTAFFLSSYFRNCLSLEDINDPLLQKDKHIEVIQFHCPEGWYSRLATLFFTG